MRFPVLALKDDSARRPCWSLLGTSMLGGNLRLEVHANKGRSSQTNGARASFTSIQINDTLPTLQNQPQVSQKGFEKQNDTESSRHPSIHPFSHPFTRPRNPRLQTLADPLLSKPL